jgi:isopentenyl diphosphate isomerase/L-lactate dehydrogenase-like FMN-dependent dehydrogenase
MVGRPVVYGLAAMGERGAHLALQILRDETDATLALLGSSSLAALDRSALLDVEAARGSDRVDHKRRYGKVPA